MEKNVEISVLCQIYGKTLTEKQYEIINDYYNNDLSLSEIAENNGITRQAVRDIIKKSENKLYELEKQISAMKKMIKTQNSIEKIEKEIAEIKKISEDKKIDKAIENIRKQVYLIKEN